MKSERDRRSLVAKSRVAMKPSDDWSKRSGWILEPAETMEFSKHKGISNLLLMLPGCRSFEPIFSVAGRGGIGGTAPAPPRTGTTGGIAAILAGVKDMRK
jgi:hypothetical protein